MTSTDEIAAPPPAADGPGRVIVVFGFDEADLDAKLAALDDADAGDEIFAFRWLSEGETPPPAPWENAQTSEVAGATKTEDAR